MRIAGYMTVEASFVIPISVALILFIIYASFYLYNRCEMTQSCYTAAYRESVWKGSGHSGAEEFLHNQNDLLMKDESGEIQKDGKMRGIRRGVLTPVSLYALFPGVKNRWEIQSVMTARKYDPPKSFRRYRRVTAVIAKGGEKESGS